ncbi:MAG: autotransporter outer membrane beta-barrel domain-containing protein [Sutterella wadsworthensis]
MLTFTKSMLALSVMAAVGGVNAATYTENTTLADKIFTQSVTAIDGATVTVTGDEITGKLFKATNHPSDVGSQYSYEQSKILLGNAETKKITINNSYTGSAAAVLSGLSASGPSDDHDYAGSQIYVTTKDLVMNLHSDNYYVYGINAMNATTNRRDENSELVDGAKETVKVVINAENTIINATTGTDIDPQYKEHRAIGIVAFSEAEVEINGNLYVNAGSVIATRGKGLININKDKNADTIVQLNGDINFNYDQPTSKTPVRAVVNINLLNDQSFLKGNIVTNGQNIPEGYDKVDAMNLGLSNGGTWYIPEVVAGLDQNDVAINLDINGGVVDVAESDRTILVKKLEGEGGTLKIGTVMNADGTFEYSTMNVEAADADNATAFTIAYQGITADDIDNAEEAMQALDDVVNVENSAAVIQKKVIAEGDINGAITQVTDTQGEVIEEVKQEVNQKLDGYSSIAALSAVQWRHENDTLQKRMGELRDSEGTIGAWARVYGSEQEYGAQSVTAKNTTVQVGADYDIGSGFKLGGAFSYTDGSSTFDMGESDANMYGVALYGTWLADSGLYVDVIGKYSRLENEFTSGTMKGEFDNNAMSLAVETGWHYALNELGFVEPSVGVTYGRIMGDDFVAHNGVKVEQDDYDSLIGRLGVRSGFYFPEKKGNIYARVAVLHDFMGDMEATASKANAAGVMQTTHLKEDLGDTWVEYGIGANFNLSKNAYTFVDLEKTAGSDVKENWKWTVGARLAF